MKQTKSVWQYHDKAGDLEPVFAAIRHMANEAIRVGDEKNLTSRGGMYRELYGRLHDDHDVYAKYVQSALMFGLAKLKQYRKAKKENPDVDRPYITKERITLDNQEYVMIDGTIQVPIRAGEYAHIQLASHVLEGLKGVKPGSITITPEKLFINYSADIEKIASTGG